MEEETIISIIVDKIETPSLLSIRFLSPQKPGYESDIELGY